LTWDSVLDVHCILRGVLPTVSRGNQTGSIGLEDIVALCGLKRCSVGLLLVKWLDIGEDGVPWLGVYVPGGGGGV
jgi:hypothetical protein